MLLKLRNGRVTGKRMRAGVHSTRPKWADVADGCGLVRTALGQGGQTLRTDAALCAQHSADAHRRGGQWRTLSADSAHRDGRPRQPGRQYVDGLGKLAGSVWAGSATWPTECAQMQNGLGRLTRNMSNGRQTAVGSGQGLVVGCMGNKHGACAGHVMRRLRTDNRPSTWQRWLCKAVPWRLAAVRAVGREEDRAPMSKVKVPVSKAFGGERSAKELENFLWDMKTYFQVARVPDAEKVSITSMYLTGDAKLWWRSRLSNNASANRKRIETCDVLKKELKDQFLPCNTSWVARESLRNLRHTGTVRAFVKEFSSLLLDVRDMSEEDKLFNFMAGLQPWAQTELRRQGVKDLPSAIAAADCLADFKVVNDPEQRQDDPRKYKAKFGKKFKRKEKAKEAVTETFEPRAVENREVDVLSVGILNTERGIAQNALSVLQAESRVCGESHYKGLMMVAGQISGKEMKALVDTGATDNFVSDRVVHKLGLDVKPCDSQVKVVNSKAMPVSGVATTELRVGENKSAFVRGEYEGDTTARKKSKTAEAGPSNASSSKEGAHSPHVAGFCCIGKMQEEMNRRWAKAQQDCEAGPELFTYVDVLKREQECEDKYSANVRDGKRALVHSTLGKKESKTAASTRASTSVGGGGM
ncbi:UNVERIFIED_CONTAM: hypothetical protein Slati_0018900 [Sesamum latifolium]|uniref:Retrotransposon gag domain-containing protein n=1 Tax=Sesamum latifolium TaxID=2727402 RepID=A0AAW2Y677_9LAMI